MVKRLVVGLVIGLLLGALAAAVAIKGLAILTFDGAAGTAWAYILAAFTGALTGLVAGKPFWSADGKIEAGLKAFFGALLAAGGMFALQKVGDGAGESRCARRRACGVRCASRGGASGDRRRARRAFRAGQHAGRSIRQGGRREEARVAVSVAVGEREEERARGGQRG